MADVAKLAGVSHQTVSRVINGSDHVREDTRERVLDGDAHARLPPEPGGERAGHRAVEDARSRELRHHPLRPGVDALRHRARRPRGRLLRQHRQPPVPRPQLGPRGGRAAARPGRRRHPRHRARRRVAAHAVLAAARRHPRRRGRGRARTKVCPSSRSTSSPAPRSATRHLLDLGHRTVWHIAGPADWLEAQQRIAGWRSTLEAAGARPAGARRRLELARPATSSAGASLRDPEVTAVFAANDQMALGLLRGAPRGGPDVPSDVSVVGFDDCPRQRTSYLPLTTIRQDFLEVGRRGLNLMLDEIECGSRSTLRDRCHRSWSCARARPPPERLFALTSVRCRSDLDGLNVSGNIRAAMTRRRHRLRNPLGTGARRPRARRRGARVGGARVRQRRDRRVLPRTGAKLAESWALQDPDDWLEVLAARGPGGRAGGRHRPCDRSSVSRRRSPHLPRFPSSRDGTPLCRLAEFDDRPHAYPKLWKHHAAQEQADRITAVAAARRAVARALRRPHLVGVGIREGASGARGGSATSTRRPTAGSRPPTGSSGSSAAPRPATSCTAGYKGIFQDGRYPSSGYLGALHPGFADFVAQKLEHPLSPLGGRAGRPHGARRPAGRGLTGGDRGRGRQRRRARHRARRAGDRARPHAGGDGNVDVPRHERRRLAEVPGMCGVVDGGITPGLLGYEAGQSGVGDIFGWFVDQLVPAAYHDEAGVEGLDPHEHLSALARQQAVGRPRPRRARLAQRQPLGARRPRAQRSRSSVSRSARVPKTSTAR